jgi:hypothetical protein
MNFLTKNNILSMIFEQIDELDEMANAKSKKWSYEELQDRIELPLDIVASSEEGSVEYHPVKSIDPERSTEENPVYVTGKIFGHDIRTGPPVPGFPNGRRVMAFHNIEGPENTAVVRFVELDEDDNIMSENGRPVTLWFLPRNKRYGTTVEKFVPKVFDDPEEQARYDNMLLQRRAKFYIFRAINASMGSVEATNQFMKCGAPRIIASKGYGEQWTTVDLKHNYNGPNLNLELTSVADSADMNDALSKIWNFRIASDTGQPIPYTKRPNKQIRGYANAYPRSQWGTPQILDAKKHSELTRKLKLWKKSVKGGDVAFNAVTTLSIMGEVDGNQYNLSANLTIQKNIRRISKSRGESLGNVIEPIRISHSYPLPEGVREKEFTVRNFPDYYGNIVGEIVRGVVSMFLRLDPDTVLAELISNPMDIEGNTVDLVGNDNNEPDTENGLIDFGDEEF